jgi:formate-dependent nitrite reductase membrane component NrfD
MKKQKTVVRTIELIPSTRQEAWGWPAVINLFLGGAGAGLFLFSFAAKITQEGSSQLSKKFDFEIIGLLLVLAGFLFLTVEAGKPLRGGYLFRGLRKAWLSRETLFAFIFVMAAMLERLTLFSLFRIVTVLAATAFMVSQGFILYQMRNIRTWNVSAIPFFFISSGLASGAGIVLLTTTIEQISKASTELMIAIIAIAFNSLMWVIYLYRINIRTIKNNSEGRSGYLYRSIMVLIGHLVGIIFLLSLIILPARMTSALGDIVIALSGFIILGCIFVQKAMIVLDVCKNIEILIDTH